MKISLPEVNKVPLKPGQLTDLAQTTREAFASMQEQHDAFNRRADKLRAEIASRYAGEAFGALSPDERRRVAEHETAARVVQMRRDAIASMDAIAEKQIGPAMAAVAASKPLYRSPAATLSRLTLGSERRTQFAANLAGAGPTDLWHAAVTALQTPDPDLAAAVVHVVNGMPMEQQPFSAVEFASRFAFPPHENAVDAINSIDRDAQAAILLWRVVSQGKENPVGRVKQAMWEPVLDEADTDAVGLPE